MRPRLLLAPLDLLVTLLMWLALALVAIAIAAGLVLFAAGLWIWDRLTRLCGWKPPDSAP